jgi:hypothetical protein
MCTSLIHKGFTNLIVNLKKKEKEKEKKKI